MSSFYDFNQLEAEWQKNWADNKTFNTKIDKTKPKFYSLDMFPYPSGAGLHVGHPLGYIASDIVSRFKRLKGFNVLHPMGYDSFGLPAEQYAIQTGQHPEITTKVNTARYRTQLDKIGFSFEWDREVKTSSSDYYKWTQWIFLQLFDSWYNDDTQKAEGIESLISIFKKEGNGSVKANSDQETVFTAEEWNGYTKEEQQKILLNYRLTYLADTTVNWCSALGTVLANDEIKDGLSERGGHPVEQKKMRQWSMRITAYADRLLNDLEGLDWSESVKEIQRNWIGKSKGAKVFFDIDNSDRKLEIFTTRPDTIFGATYMTIAPEHDWVQELTTEAQRTDVEAYVEKAKNRSERDRMSDVKTISGVFTGSFAIHPFSGKKIEIWIGDYVLATYGTGAVMAVPAHDSRDYAFAKHFGLPIEQVVDGGSIEEESYDAKEGKMINSDFLNGLEVKAAIQKVIEEMEKQGRGQGQINYKMRNAVFGRQRYWGEPIPMYFKEGIPYPVAESDLPLELPKIDEYLPTESGEPPLGRAADWKYEDQYEYELSTMPGWAGSSWYMFRYMDSNNDKEFCGSEALDYWGNVDLYIGGAEHATGHLLYARFWTKFLYDREFLKVQEPFQKMINQGMIQGRSSLVYKVKGEETFVSKNLRKEYQTTTHHVDVNIVSNDELDIDAFKADKRFEASNASFILEDGKYICGDEIEKMAKRLWNVVNPDDVIERYGADTLRLYEMFLGPLEQFKPWNTQGIDGVHRFLKRFWRLFWNENDVFDVSDEEPTKEELKVLHETIKKVEWDMENYSFNTSVSQFMICLNELNKLKCNKRAILEPFVLVLSPYAPHITEALWKLLGKNESLAYVPFPVWDEAYLKEDDFEYPVMINGKVRTKISFGLDVPKEEIHTATMANDIVQKWLEGNEPKRVIIVPKKIINIVL